MGLREEIQGIVNGIVTGTVLDNIPVNVTLSLVTIGTYNPATGTLSNTVQTFQCKGILTSLSQREVPNQVIDVTDRKLLLPCLQLPATVDVNALSDQVVIEGAPWTVFAVKQDPTAALFTFFLKSRQGVQLATDG